MAQNLVVLSAQTSESADKSATGLLLGLSWICTSNIGARVGEDDDGETIGFVEGRVDGLTAGLAVGR